MVRKRSLRCEPISENKNEICREMELKRPLDPVALADCLVEKSINRIRAELIQ